MTDLLARVVLHNADESDYEKLHEKMLLHGYKRTIEGNKGNYHLPDATYITSKNISSADAAREIIELAESVKPFSQSLVVQYNSANWVNLDPA